MQTALPLVLIPRGYFGETEVCADRMVQSPTYGLVVPGRAPAAPAAAAAAAPAVGNKLSSVRASKY